MAYSANQKGTGLDALTSLESDDVIIVADDSDSGRAKKITKANLVTDLADETQTLTNKTIDADGTGNSITNIENADIKAAAAIVGSKIVAATDSARGTVELATAAETTTGTDTGRAVTPDGFAGSDWGIRYLQAIVVEFTTDAATGDGKFYFHIPPALNGMNLVYVHAECITAGTTGTMDIQLHEVVGAVDMLSTKLTIDSGETGSDTAATPAVINTSNDDVATNDLIRVDIDAIQTTPAKGLIITLGFQLP